MPAQLTTTSQAMSPREVPTPATAPPRVRIAVTAVFSRIVTPPWRAPFARASVVSMGLVRPSRGSHTAPARSSVRRSGQRRPRLGRRDHLGVDVEAARHRRQARQLVHALGIARQAEAARAAEARGLTRLRLEALVEIGAVLGEPGEVVGGTELAHQPGGMPRGPARQLAALEQHDVAPAELGQVIRHAAAGDAPADHHHARLSGHRVTHPRLLHWVNFRQIHSTLASQRARLPPRSLSEKLS
jgi:hypothetical protein